MSGGEGNGGELKRLDAEDTLARFVESPWSDPRALVDGSDPASDLAGARDRRRRHLGRLATGQVVVLPQLTNALAEPAQVNAAADSSRAEGGSES